ncbi:MAG: RHS repeat-associated core domain-containing protein [Minicystis sp.]
MSGKVTALGLDVITEKSGHAIAPVSPSVCITPAAPSPIPMPYPVTGSSRECIAGAPSRTRVNGAPLATVGSAFKASHGNEPGTMKEIVSHNTGGAAPLLLGAPVVLCELGMTGITGSPVMSNKSPGNTSRSAPAPMPGVSMTFGTAVLGGGAGSGSANGTEGGGNCGDQGAGGDNVEGDGCNAPAGHDGQCAGGHPVDVITGRAYTLPAVDLELPGPLPLVLARVYSTTAAERDTGLGFGWSCSWSWEIEVRRRKLVVWSDEGIATDFPALDLGAEHVGPWGWTLLRERERFVLDKNDGLRRVFAAVDEDARRWKLIEIRDRNDNRIEFIYDGDGRLCEITDSAGRTIGVESTRAGRTASIQVKNARTQGRWIAVARFAYDESGNLVAVVDAEGNATRYAYDDAHRLTRETDRCGLAFCFVYDHAGRCIETWGEYPGRRDPSLAEDVPVTLADGRTRARGVHHVRLDYHEGRYTEVADSTQIRRYFGNRYGLADKRIEGFGVEEATYDARGLLLSETDGEEAVTRYERDARGWVLGVIDPIGRTTTYERDARGDVVRVVDPAGGVHELNRDGRGNVIHEADPTGAVITTTYDARGLVTSITSPLGGVMRFGYDDEGNLVKHVGPTGVQWRWSYDALGRRVQEIDPLGNETRFAWTERGNLAAIFRADGTVTRYLYDGERRLCEVQGPGRRTLGLTWGGYNKLIAKTDGAGGTVRMRYDREGALVEVVNELGELHRLRRNGAGLVVREETFDGRLVSYRHDRAGRIVREEVAGEAIESTYDAAGDLVRRALSDDAIEFFSYGARGDLAAVRWTGGELRFERDAAGRLLREVQVFGGEEHDVASLYDKAGERVRRFSSRGHVEYVERDAAGARTRTILDELHDVHHAHDALGREGTRALPGGGRMQHAYDPLGRAKRRWSTSAGSLRPVRFDDPAWSSAGVAAQPDRVTVEHEYRYSPEGERSDAFDRRRGWLQYDYDAAGRLTSVLREATGEREAFTYDAVGNQRPEGVPCEYGPGGRLLRRGHKTYAWDAAGRLREQREGAKLWRYAWDAAGRLATIDLPDGQRVAYAYDPLGRRLEARTYEAPPTAGRARLKERTRFIWDGDTIVHAIRARATSAVDPVVEERTFCFEDGSFVPWAHRETSPDGYGGRRSTWAYYVNDPIGTPEELVGGDGAVLAELDREAWGKTTAYEGARATTPLRYQGQYADAETGLFYNRFRYYDPESGLYLSPDPLGLEGGPRAYGYGINPVRWIRSARARLPHAEHRGHLSAPRPVGKRVRREVEIRGSFQPPQEGAHQVQSRRRPPVLRASAGDRWGRSRAGRGGLDPRRWRPRALAEQDPRAEREELQGEGSLSMSHTRTPDKRPSRKRTKFRVGDLFAVPLKDGTWGLGHVVAADLAICCLVFAARAASTDALRAVLDDALREPIGAAVITDFTIARGTWPVIGHRAPHYPDLRLPKLSGEGASSYTDGVLAEFLEAYHGLRPWNEWPEVATWYRDILLSHLPIPSTARFQGAPAVQPAARKPSSVTEGPAIVTVRIVYPGTGFPSADLVRRRHEMERRLEAEGAGEVEGAESGAGTMQVFLRADDVRCAVPLVEKIGAELGFADDMLIETAPVEENDEP